MSDFLSLNQLIAERVREHPNLEILGFPDDDFNWVKYTTKELDVASNLLANHLKDNGILSGRTKGDITSRLTVALLGVSNIGYVVTQMALFRMGYCVFFLSPNNSPPAIAHLLTITNTSHVIVQDALFPSADAAITCLADSSSVSIITQPASDIFGLDAWATHPDKASWDLPLSPEEEHLLPISILHSSGSTGYPKPIIATNMADVAHGRTHLGLAALTTLPLYHAQGHLSLIRSWYSAKSLYLFPTGSVPLTSGNVIKLLSQAPEVECLYGVPLALKLLAETQEGVKALKSLKLVTSGGSACPDGVGNYLVSEGVPLVLHYGLTETGHLMTSIRDFGVDKEWNWLRAKGLVRNYIRFEPRGGNTYELYVLDGWPSKVLSNQPDGSYATKDIFIRHPRIPDAYKCIGRVDDTLIMLNGEKTNPVPIEVIIRSSPYVADVIVFGTGRTQIGALILPTEAAQYFSHEEFNRHIASVVVLANAEAPSHSQLSLEALIFLPYHTQIPRADKGSFLRAKVYGEFANVIEELYRRLEGEVGPEGKMRVEGEEEAREVLRELIGRTIGRRVDELEDNSDLFDFGFDSLQSTRIRNAIQRDIDLGGNRLPSNAVFEHPSIIKLAKLITLLSSGKEISDLNTNSQEVMLALVNKYGHFTYPQTHGTNVQVTRTSGKVVVLTGATGSLGSYILHELLADSTVETVYCLCRAKDDADATDRLLVSMRKRKLLSRFLGAGEAGANERVVAIAADLSTERLGLTEGRYLDIANQVTVIIHNAWAVNFNLGISSFETQVRGAVNLMHLALSSRRSLPAQFFFSSSVSAVANWTGTGLVPEVVMDDVAIAQEMGYAQSKWVVEKLCQIASRTTPMQTVILRIGQMVGDTTNGIWNESEAISLIFKCADTIGILPELDEQVSWLPVDYAAKSIVELVNLPTHLTSTSDSMLGNCAVYHALQPNYVSWCSIISALLAADLRFKVVPQNDWLKALRASERDEDRNPSRKLLTYYERKYGGSEKQMKAALCVEKTIEVSKWLRSAPVVGESLVVKWVGAWRQSRFLARI